MTKLYEKNFFSQSQNIILASFESEMSYNLEKRVQLYDNRWKCICLRNKKVI